MTIAELVHAAAARLTGAGATAEDARRDAAVLARHVLGWDLAHWVGHQRDQAPPGFDRLLDALIVRRAAHEPLAYITGVREFYGRVFRVSSAVLVPRPETEMLVDDALRAIDRCQARTPLVVDVGTGSGCIAITLALERPNVRVIATDVSPEALAVAHRNAEDLRAAAQIRFICAPLLGRLDEPPDVIVSNPPYVSEADRPNLPLEVRGYEPGAALFAGLDGLDVIRELVVASARALVRDGALVFEIGAGQAPAVTRLVSSTAGLVLERVRLDLQSIPRVVVASARGPAQAAPTEHVQMDVEDGLPRG